MRKVKAFARAADKEGVTTGNMTTILDRIWAWKLIGKVAECWRWVWRPTPVNRRAWRAEDLSL